MTLMWFHLMPYTELTESLRGIKPQLAPLFGECGHRWWPAPQRAAVPAYVAAE